MASLMGEWLHQQHENGIMNIISTPKALENVKNEELKDASATIYAPSFGTQCTIQIRGKNCSYGGERMARSRTRSEIVYQSARGI